ncbi:unnamed protein product [Brassicogethes aeneus]|uniref:Uncharacterized protein n=1 Tax=Brassicogethes aeneus TaxID=1431903 RepID=A0A9P0AYX1_BRAAE|nr:unnamed protein product [Brassicogethes aeneus]
MSEKTPKKNLFSRVSFNGFSPVILPVSPAAGSPQKNLTGSPRVARDIVADLYNNIQRWNDLHIKGSNIVKQIAVFKSDNPNKFTPELEDYTNALYEVVVSLVVYRNCFENLTSQIKALSKLNKEKEILFISLNGIELSNLVESISLAYRDEFKVKEHILENIAHTKGKNEVMFYAASWTHQCNITSDVNFKLETLLVETGHRNFN